MSAPVPGISSAMIEARGIATAYLHQGDGEPVVLVHGSGPGVNAFSNWRLTIPSLAKHHSVFAPDMVGFGGTERPVGVSYDLDTWVGHLVGFLDALGIARASLVGNSFGGAVALRFAVEHPDRVHKMVLMGSAGLSFPMTEGLDRAWGYTPSLENMRQLLDVFAFSRDLVTDELARVRFEASVAPGVQEAFSSMFPPPRQQGIEALATPEGQIAALRHEVLLVHGREDRVIPLESSLRLLTLIPNAELHVFGRSGHWTQIEWAREFNALLSSFLLRPERT